MTSSKVFSATFPATPPSRNEWIFTLKNVINKTPTKMTRQWLCHPPQTKKMEELRREREFSSTQNQKTFRWNILRASTDAPFRKLQNHGCPRGWNRKEIWNENGSFSWFVDRFQFKRLGWSQSLAFFYKLDVWCNFHQRMVWIQNKVRKVQEFPSHTLKCLILKGGKNKCKGQTEFNNTFLMRLNLSLREPWLTLNLHSESS